ncbi:MAG: hypothetical protein JSV56_01000 [Methanomassiliicoccales archaeon]|nr:MAG: hypothetical protein JSV56_01000 [Methanomassiliicoccales archaeon]
MMGEENSRCPECGLVLYQEVPQCPRCFAIIKPPPSEGPMVERVYEEEVVKKTPKERKDIKRTSLILITLIIVICIIIALSYNFIIPRIELNVITRYRESTGLSINLDSKVNNEGTLSIQYFTMNITITNSSDILVAKGDYFIADLDAHSSHNLDNIHFFGDQYEPYRITIKVNFEAEGKDYSENYEHTVSESMYINYEDKFMQWGG